MRKEHHGLIDLAAPLGVQFVNHHGQRHGDHDVQHDEHQIVQDRVAKQHPEGIVVNKKLEVVEANPRALQQVGQIIKEGLPGEDLVLLEGDHQSEHGQIAEQGVPHEGGKAQQTQFQIVSRPAVLVPGFGCRFGRGSVYHAAPSVC